MNKKNSRKKLVKNIKIEIYQKYRFEILIILFVLAIIVRIYNDPNIPYHYDPGKNIVYERAALDSFPSFPQYNSYFNLGEYYEYQVLFPYIIALLYKITGFSLVDLTSRSIIIIGSLMVITVYLLSKEIFDNIVAGLISALLIVIDKIQLFSYMNYYPQILALTLLPLSFVFIIRYTKTLDKKYLIYTSILSSIIILSSYLAGIVYLSILALSLIIYSITKKKLKYIYSLILIIIGIITLVAFYILPIIDRHGIRTFIIGIIDTIFTKKDVPFTNGPADVNIPIVFQFIIVILLIIGMSLIIYLFNRISQLKTQKIDFNKIKYEHILLFVWISISLILVESYKFRPILWVDRYIEFFDIGTVIIVGYSIYFILNKIKSNKSGNSGYRLVSILILILIFIYPTYDIIIHNYGFGYWNTPNDLEALNYIQSNIPSESLFATPSGIASFWISALGGVHVLGGESSQMLGDRFDGNNCSDTIINSPNIEEKMKLIREFGVQYIYLTIRTPRFLLWRNDYSYEGFQAFNNSAYFDFIYYKKDDISTVYILKVKENLIPKYNIQKINEKVTILGYIISIMALIIMISIIMRENYNGD